jgi:hypothetical protein
MSTLKMGISKAHRAYIPPEMIDAGFTGELEIITAPFAAAILKPGASLDQVKRSLELTIQDLQLQIDSQTPAAR